MPKFVVTTTISFLVNTDETDPIDREHFDFSQSNVVAEFYGGRDNLQDLFELVAEPIYSARLATPAEIAASEAKTAAFSEFLGHHNKTRQWNSEKGEWEDK